MNIAIWLITILLLAAAVMQASAVFAPVAFALFVIALVWPLQRRLQAVMPKLLALAVTIIVTVTVCLAFSSLAAWGFGRIGRLLASDASRYEALYEAMMTWLEDRGVSIAGLWAEHFNVPWLLGMTQTVTGRVASTLGFWLIALVYVVLGLLEVEDVKRRIEALRERETARILLDGSAATAMKFRRYMVVRTQMSLGTGLLVGCFAWAVGLPSALEWGVIAFTLNYIPFIGPFIATLLPTLMAMTRFGSWEAVFAIFVCLNLIQFVVGSYIEPRIAGSMLSLSPSIVIFSVVSWTFLWGVFGAFIGVPIMLAIVSFCSQHESSRWIAELLGGSDKTGTATP